MSDTNSTYKLLIDQETKVDLLNNEAMARTIVSVIDNASDKPMTIGVHGDWGAGKSSILEMIEGAYKGKKKVVCLKFNGWQFQGFEDAKIAVIEGIVNELIENQSLLTKAREEVKNIWRRIDWLKVAKKSGGLAFTAFTGLPTGDQIKGVIDSANDLISDPSQLATKENVTKAAETLSGLLKEPESKNLPHEIHEFRKAFEKLVEKAGIDRLVVLIDDLDRCLPETAIETLEAIRLFVFLPKTAFVVGADEAMIEYAVRQHFPDLPESNSSISYARNYLEKLIQVPIRIPALGETETHIYVTLLLIGSALGETDPSFEKILQLGRNALKKPWEGKSIDSEKIREIMKDDYSKVSDAIILSNQIAPMLSTGTKGNPRQIKRFINALNLRLQTSAERGFGSAISASHLAKLMLAEMFLPSLFEHLATSVANSDEGICQELYFLEKENESKESSMKKSKKDTEESDTSSSMENNIIFSDWKMRSEVMKWVKIAPLFGKTLLKPYLFVIKDRKNYLSSSAPLDPKLRILFEKLSGGEATARSCANDLKKLLQTEIEILFKELQQRIQTAESLLTKPAAMFGISELVAAHPALQLRYVELLEGLPTPKLGVWVVAGHEKLVTDSAATQKLHKIKDGWSTKSATLKTAINASTTKART